MEIVPVAGTDDGAAPRCHHCCSTRTEVVMSALVSLGILLIVLWAVLWLGFHIVGWLIHLLIIVGLILLVWGLIKRGARAVDRHI
jgi:hypothetical protein